MLFLYLFSLVDGSPTSVDFVRSDANQMVASFTTANTVIYDLETGKSVVHLESNQNSGKIVLPLTIFLISCFVIGKLIK